MRIDGEGEAKKVSKPKMLGYFKPCVPNNKADQRRNKPFKKDNKVRRK
jgi:hypothetical protein